MANTLYADDGSLRITVVNGTTLTGLNAPDGSMYVVEGNPAIHRGLYHPCGAMLVKVTLDSTTTQQTTAYSPEGYRNICLPPFTTNLFTGAARCTIVSGSFAITPPSNFTANVEFDFVNKTYKEGSVYKDLLSNLSISRASTATFVNNKGMVDTAAVNTARLTHELGTGKPLGLLLEPAATNLVYSSQNINANWNVGGGITITNNSDYAPDGTKTAVTINQTAGNANSYLYQVISVGVAASTVYTLSFYVKPNNFPSSDLVIGIADQTTVPFFVRALPSLPQNKWSRVSFTFTSTVGATNLRVFPYRQPTSYATPPVNSGTIQLWGIQVETGNAASSYIPTVGTQVTRSPDTGALLSSGAFNTGLVTTTTNLALQSNSYDDATWGKTAGVSVAPNTATAPDSSLTADVITVDTSASQSLYQTFPVTPNTVYTFSQYVNLGTFLSAEYKFAIYDITNSVLLYNNQVPNVILTSGVWLRFDFTFTTPADCSSIRIYPYRNSAVTSGGTFSLWGSQLEQLDTYTDLVPTTTTIATASSFQQCTLYSEFYTKPSTSTTNSYLISLSPTSNNPTEAIFINHVSDVKGTVLSNNIDQTSSFTGTPTFDGALTKVAMYYGYNNSSFSLNGAAAIPDTSVNPPLETMTKAYIGSASWNPAVGVANIVIAKIALWSTRRKDADLVAITT